MGFIYNGKIRFLRDKEMSRHKLVHSAFLLVGMLLLTSLASSAFGAEAGPKLLRLAVGETTPVTGETGSYERVIVMPPDKDSTTAGNIWDISAEVAIKLARLAPEARWRAIRRNLGLAPDDSADLILWSEVLEAAFVDIAKLPMAGESGNQQFGLRVAFPDKSSADPPADVALVFDNSTAEQKPRQPVGIESNLRKDIAEAMTGVEGFAEIVGDGAIPPSAGVFAHIEVQLFDSDKKLVRATGLRQGYFCFTNLPVDADFGSDYYLKAVYKGTRVDSLANEVSTEFIYAPVMRGIRTRVRLEVQKEPVMFESPDKSLQTQNWAINGGPAAMLLQQFVAGNNILTAISERLPANPGLHLGVVQGPDGPTTLWSSRFLLRPPRLDRRPQFVSRGKMRLQVMTVNGTPEGARRHYLKMSWLAQAAPAELKLASRRVSETPWGIGVGVAPSEDPAMYVVGASYKLMPEAELLAGMGIQKGDSKSFVYGLTLDADKILEGIFGKKKD
jgi:hypothetical protein